MRVRRGHRIGTMHVQLRHHPVLPRLRRKATPKTSHTRKPTACAHHTTRMLGESERPCLRVWAGRLVCATHQPTRIGQARRRMQVHTRIRVARHRELGLTELLTGPLRMATPTQATKSLNLKSSPRATSTAILRPHRKLRGRLPRHGPRAASRHPIQKDRATAQQETYPIVSRAGVKKALT